MFGQPILFIDLHGVLVDTNKIFHEYKRLTIDHLVQTFNLNKTKASKRYDRAMELWQNEAFTYLKNPQKKKIGKEFLQFLDWCDTLFPKHLYKNLPINGKNNQLRTRPFEYEIAKKIKALYPEVKSILKNLSDQGYGMYIASSSHSSHVKGIIKANELDEFIHGLFGFDTLASTKHTLTYYKRLLKIAKVEAGSSFMIGNSIHEVLKPRKIGMRTIHINRERNVPPDIRRLADRSLNDLTSLPLHLDSIQISV